jgi:DEAD/DEAH box helicase domain-containing protein
LDWIVVDVEIQKTIEETPGGWEATDKLGVACAVIYEFNRDNYRVYGPNDIEALRQRINTADRISGFNIWKFDYPVIWGLPGRERLPELLPKTDDLLRRIWLAQGLDPEVFSKQHGGWSLDVVAGSTIGQNKTGYGGDAPKWFQQGNWPRLVDYCINDVKVERDLAVFVDRFGYVLRQGQRLAIAPWERGV